MFANKWVFDEDHVPEDLVHRDGELSQLARSFDPTLRDEPAQNVLISGRSGVGKTVTTRRSLELLRDQAPIATAQLQCLSYTRSDILRHILDRYPGSASVSKGTPALDILAKLQRTIDRPYVIVLDEADSLPNLNLLGDLLQVRGISIVAVSHEPQTFLNRSSARVQEAFHNGQIQFDPYTVDELVSILSARATHGLRPGSVDRSQLEAIACAVDGAARHAIQSLRAAADIAIDNEHDAIADADIDEGIELAKQRIRRQKLRSLSYHHHVVYELIRSSPGSVVGASALHDRYEAHADRLYRARDQTSVSRRRRRQVLEKLEQYSLVRSTGSTRWKQYTAIDPDVEAPIEHAVLIQS